jgi:hypothetical protein
MITRRRRSASRTARSSRREAIELTPTKRDELQPLIERRQSCSPMIESPHFESVTRPVIASKPTVLSVLILEEPR